MFFSIPVYTSQNKKNKKKEEKMLKRIFLKGRNLL